MDTFWMVIAQLLLVYFGIASIYLTIYGYIPKLKELDLETGVLTVLLIPLLFGLLLFGAGLVGEFGRGETSPFPWHAFMDAKMRHGISDGILTGCWVTFVDLWLLWIPANIWVNAQEKKMEEENNKYEETDDEEWKLHQKGYLSALYDLNKQRKYMVRIINLLVGLLLMTPHNPLDGFLELTFSG